MIGANPVRAPNRYWACKPPAPWHIGIAPNGHRRTFARPDDRARLRSLATDPVAGKSSRERLAVTMTAFVNVNESCGNTAISRLRQTSAHVGTTKWGIPGATVTAPGMAAPPLAHPTSAAAASTIGATG